MTQFILNKGAIGRKKDLADLEAIGKEWLTCPIVKGLTGLSSEDAGNTVRTLELKQANLETCVSDAQRKRLILTRRAQKTLSRTQIEQHLKKTARKAKTQQVS